MNQETRSIDNETPCRVATSEGPGAATTLSGAVLIGTIGEPKLPPYRGD